MINLKLYVVTHKSIDAIPKGRECIGVGPNKSIQGVNIYDNVGINISEKNKTYCELTALYWIWKNLDNDFVGLEHYRRFFCFNSLIRNKPLTVKKIEKILNKCDIILPKKISLRSSVFDHYKNSHCIEDLLICRNVIDRLYPSYLTDFDKCMRSKSISAYNMFICSKKIIDDYCEWLFPILFEAEKLIDISGRDQYQTRVFGFLSERLFNVWLGHNKFKIYYSMVLMPKETRLKSFTKKVVNKISKMFKFI